MKIGILKEIKDQEYRVSLAPNAVKKLIQAGHVVYVQKSAGQASGFCDQDYKNAGGEILENADDIFKKSTLIVKVKEPQKFEISKLHSEHILFSYLHPEDYELGEMDDLFKSKCAPIAFEFVTDDSGRRVLLEPMSEISGKLAVIQGLKYLEKTYGGSGILIGGLPSIDSGTIVIIGCGNAGYSAACMAINLGAKVIVIHNNINRLEQLKHIFKNPNVTLLLSSDSVIADSIKLADIVIGAVNDKVLSNGHRIITRNMLKTMKPGSVLIDINCGAFETSKIMSHENPIYIVDDIVHYCVSNMPGVFPKTSSAILSDAIFPFVLKLANHGLNSLKLDNGLSNALILPYCRDSILYKAIPNATDTLSESIFEIGI